jgi:hypothetical protein
MRKQLTESRDSVMTTPGRAAALCHDRPAHRIMNPRPACTGGFDCVSIEIEGSHPSSSRPSNANHIVCLLNAK